MTLFETLKLLHVLAAMVWLGGGILQTILVWRVRRADLPHRLGLARDMKSMGDRVFGAATVAVLAFGIWMVIEQPAFAFGDTWILIGIAGILISGAIGGAFFAPKGKALVATLESGQPADALLHNIAMVAVVDQLVLITVVWAMVAKPGA
jgi:uncharacterized membrane protein